MWHVLLYEVQKFNTDTYRAQCNAAWLARQSMYSSYNIIATSRARVDVICVYTYSDVVSCPDPVYGTRYPYPVPHHPQKVGSGHETNSDAACLQVVSN